MFVVILVICTYIYICIYVCVCVCVCVKLFTKACWIIWHIYYMKTVLFKHYVVLDKTYGLPSIKNI